MDHRELANISHPFLFLLSGGRWACHLKPLIVSVVLTVLIAGSTSAAGPETKPELEQNWQVLLMGGQRIGYSHGTHRERIVDGRKVHESDTLTFMKLTRFGQTLEMKQMLHLLETEDGHLLKFTSTVENPPNSRIVSTGVVDGDRLSMITVAAGTEQKSVVDGMRGLYSPSWPEQTLVDKPLAEGEQRTFEIFDPQLGKKSTMTLTGKPRTTTKLLDGKEARVGYVEIVQSIPGLPKITMDLYLNDAGETIKVTTPLLGMEAYSVSEEEAKRELGTGEVDLAIGTLLKVEPIEAPHDAREIVYRIRVDGTNPVELFAQGGTQDVDAVNDREIKLTVRSLRPGERAALRRDHAPGKEFLKPTRYLEADAPLIRELATGAATNLNRPTDIAIAFEKFVHELVEEKDFSTSMATALETARNRSGDCTEHAVLLAALLRAQSIPSRVAIGFVYSAQHAAFVGHMWTEAWLDGAWVPLDATLARGGIGAGHIKVADSSLADAGNTPVAEFIPLIHILGRTTIEVLDRK